MTNLNTISPSLKNVAACVTRVTGNDSPDADHKVQFLDGTSIEFHTRPDAVRYCTTYGIKVCDSLEEARERTLEIEPDLLMDVPAVDGGAIASGSHTTGRVSQMCGILGHPGRLDWQLHAPLNAGERHTMTIQWHRKNDSGELVLDRKYRAPVADLTAQTILGEVAKGIGSKGRNTTGAGTAGIAIRYSAYRVRD